ncbi:MAG: LPS-assembly protein LptD [Dechloromonas sp.]|nr:LPS-assembly protein LptD [Dechloromonas sp.]
MPGFPRRRLTLLICCLLGGLSSVPVAVAGSTEVDAGLGLRVENQFNVLGKPDKAQPNLPGVPHPVLLQPGDAYPLFIVADQMTGLIDQSTEAEGSVEMRRADQLLYADYLRYLQLEDEVEAKGHVRLLQEGSEVQTPYLRLQLVDRVGHTEKASYFFTRQVDSRFYQAQNTVVTVATASGTTSGAPMMLNVDHSYGLPTTQPAGRLTAASGEAERIDFEGENQIRMWSSTYSTCKPGATDWYLRTQEMLLDYDDDVGTARHATLVFKELPILYTPVAWFPLNQQRRSGVLHPSFSTSTRNGLDISMPYYWNIAPNYDATLFPRYMSKRGLQLGGEVRYLGALYNGDLRGEYLPNDQTNNLTRYAYSVRHNHALGRGVGFGLNLNGVSDDTYWQDISSRLMQTSQVQLPRQAVLSYAPSSWLQSNVQVLRYQTLQTDPLNPVTRPYFLEPQINLIGYRPNVFKTDLSLIGQFSRFTHPSKTNGDRLVFYPQVSLPIVNPGFQIIPKLGLHTTYYNLSDPTAANPTSLNRLLPTFTLDSTVIFERPSRLLDVDYIQTLEPRLYYVNIPYKDQSAFPVFDTGLADFNFAQIFSENRYSGYDRVNDANQLTAAVSSRFIDANSGVERFKATIGQRYYFSPQKVQITGETTRQADFSNLVAAVNGLVANKTYMDMAWEYNTKAGSHQRLAAGMRYQPDYGKVLSASYRYTRDPLTMLSTVDQVDVAGQWPVAPRWYAVGRYNWSLRDKQLLEAIGGVEYNAGCWSMRLVAQRLAAVTGAPNDAVYFQLELNDFGSIGSNPIGLLRRSVPGYGKTNELPTQGTLLTTP